MKELELNSQEQLGLLSEFFEEYITYRRQNRSDSKIKVLERGIDDYISTFNDEESRMEFVDKVVAYAISGKESLPEELLILIMKQFAPQLVRNTSTLRTLTRIITNHRTKRCYDDMGIREWGHWRTLADLSNYGNVDSRGVTLHMTIIYMMSQVIKEDYASLEVTRSGDRLATHFANVGDVVGHAAVNSGKALMDSGAAMGVVYLTCVDAEESQKFWPYPINPFDFHNNRAPTTHKTLDAIERCYRCYVAYGAHPLLVITPMALGTDGVHVAPNTLEDIFKNISIADEPSPVANGLMLWYYLVLTCGAYHSGGLMNGQMNLEDDSPYGFSIPRPRFRVDKTFVENISMKVEYLKDLLLVDTAPYTTINALTKLLETSGLSYEESLLEKHLIPMLSDGIQQLEGWVRYAKNYNTLNELV